MNYWGSLGMPAPWEEDWEISVAGTMKRAVITWNVLKVLATIAQLWVLFGVFKRTQQDARGQGSEARSAQCVCCGDCCCVLLIMVELLIVAFWTAIGRAFGVSPVPRVPWAYFDTLFLATAFILCTQVCAYVAAMKWGRDYYISLRQWRQEDLNEVNVEFGRSIG